MPVQRIQRLSTRYDKYIGIYTYVRIYTYIHTQIFCFLYVSNVAERMRAEERFTLSALCR